MTKYKSKFSVNINFLLKVISKENMNKSFLSSFY